MLSILIIFYLVFFGVPQATVVLLAVVLLLLVLMTLELSCLLTPLGIYLLDVAQIIEVTTIRTDVPAADFLSHRILTGGISSVYLLLSSMIAWLDFAWFQKPSKESADVP